MQHDMTEHQFRIESIADHLGLVPTIAQWHWDAWGHADPDGSHASWTAGLRERTHRDRVPTTYVALAGDELLGSVTLVEHDMATNRNWSPWLAGLYVAPAHRRQGVASALVRHAVRAAAAMGIVRLYLFTESARGFYERLGWQPVGQEAYEGAQVTIMAIDIHEPGWGRCGNRMLT
jgi:GNAT superfamily N-acetyltransferase